MSDIRTTLFRSFSSGAAAYLLGPLDKWQRPGDAATGSDELLEHSARSLRDHLPGVVLTDTSGQPLELLVQRFSHSTTERDILVPAVAEPLVVWVVRGRAFVEERELGSSWSGNMVAAGDVYITNSETPYEMRWRSDGDTPFEVLHVYIGLTLLARAVEEIFGTRQQRVSLREVSAESDSRLSLLLGAIDHEIARAGPASQLFLNGIASALAVHLVRDYRDPHGAKISRRSMLPAHLLRSVTQTLAADLSREFSLDRLAGAVGMSPFHFSRMFKRSTGFSPSRYFIRLRMAEAQRLLRETTDTVIQIGLAVGYGSPSHFAQIFKREVGVSPSSYRA